MVDLLSKYNELMDELEVNIATYPDFEQLVNFSENEVVPIHRWYYFKEGYSHRLVEKLLKEADIGTGSTVLDPFAGSGTTLLTAQWRGMHSLGVDINPFFTFVQKTKLNWHKYDSKNLRKEILKLSAVNRGEEPSLEPPQLSSFARKKKPVYLDETLRELLLFKEKIYDVDTELTRNFLLLGLASILETVSLVRKDGKGLKFVRGKKPPSVKSTLLRKLNDMFSDLMSIEKLGQVGKEEARVFTTDTRDEEFVDKIGSGQADFVMFSPPYLNTFDYTEVYKLELWFLDLVRDYKEFKMLRARTLRSHNLWNWEPTELWKHELLKEVIRQVRERRLWTRIIPTMIQGYFDDMFLSMENISRTMKNNSYCVIVVGNSSYGNVPIPTDLLLARIAKDVDLMPVEIRVARQLTTSSQQLKTMKDGLKDYLRESVLILKKEQKI